MLLLVLWSGFLVLWPSQGTMEGNNQDVCQGTQHPGELYVLEFVNNSLQEDYLEMTDVNETFTCLLYPTNLLNCSWSFLTLEKDMQLSVYISVCNDTTAVQRLSQSPEQRVGSRSLVLQQHDMLNVILQFNMSQHDQWRVYTSKYDMDILEVLSPPANVSAAFKDGDLLVTWGPPNRKSRALCFEYQLDLGNQKPPKQLESRLSYAELNADPTIAYTVRMRTRKLDACSGSAQWSEWSPTAAVEASRSPDKVDILSIVLISFGIPMILLAFLLLVRHQRLSQLLFPPIPRPPRKYIDFLNENDMFNSFHPVLPSKAEEEITEVEDEQDGPGKTF